MKKLEAQRKEEILAPSLQLAVGGEVANTGAFLPSPTLFTKLPGLELCTPGKLTKKHLHSREEASRGRRKSESLPGKESSQEPFPSQSLSFPRRPQRQPGRSLFGGGRPGAEPDLLSQRRWAPVSQPFTYLPLLS